MNTYKWKDLGAFYQQVHNDLAMSIVHLCEGGDITKSYYRIYIHKHEGTPKDNYVIKDLHHFDLDKAKQEAIELFEEYINDKNKL